MVWPDEWSVCPTKVPERSEGYEREKARNEAFSKFWRSEGYEREKARKEAFSKFCGAQVRG